MIILSDSSAHVCDLHLEPFCKVSSRAYELVKKRLEMGKLFFNLETQDLEVVKLFVY